MNRRPTFGAGMLITPIAKAPATSPFTAITPVAKPSATSAPLTSTPITPQSSGSTYTPSTGNAVGTATQTYQSIDKVPAYQGNFQIPVMQMPTGGGLKTPPSPSASPSPVIAPPSTPKPSTPAPYTPQPDYTAAPSYDAAPSPAPIASSASTSPASSDPSLSVTVSPASPLAIPSGKPISVPATATTPITPTTAVVKPSIWTRILRFFGLAKSDPPAAPTVHGEPLGMTQERVAISLVRRARSGDQNAMATLDMIGKNARRGDPTAKRSYELCMKYAKSNPHDADIGGEGGIWEDDGWDDSIPEGDKSDPLFAQAVAISHGPLLTRDAVMGYAANFGGEEEVYAFAEGMRMAAPLPYGDSRATHASHLGAVMGIARRIQQARESSAGLGLYDARIRAELC